MANHLANYWKSAADATRCDNILPAATAATVPAVIQPATVVPLITTPVGHPLVPLARRERTDLEYEALQRSQYTITNTAYTDIQVINLVDIQDLFAKYLGDLQSLCSQEFWRIFLSIHTCAIGDIDACLSSVKDTFVNEKQDKKMFPGSRRALLERLQRIPPFFSRVLHTYTVDLSPFVGKLPSGTRSVVFRFIDPLWAWVQAARKQDPIELHWKPIAQKVGHERYGGGVQYGEFLAKSCAEVPAGTYPMCFGLHWDGTSARGQHSAPICICIGNTNSCDSSTQYCIGYMPHVPDERKPEWKKKKIVTEVKYYIRQKCQGAILRIMLDAATRGVRVRLQNRTGREVARVLFPRLSSMNFDQPEAQLMFGLQNKQACSKCRQAIIVCLFKVLKFLPLTFQDILASHRNTHTHLTLLNIAGYVFLTL